MKVSITTLEQSALIQKAIEKGYQAITLCRNYPGLDPDGNYVWWYDAARNPVNFSGLLRPRGLHALLDQGRETADPAAREQIYQERQPASLASEALHAVDVVRRSGRCAAGEGVHGVVGARPPDGRPDYTGLAPGARHGLRVEGELSRGPHP